MFYVLQFIVGGTVMMLAAWLSRSNFHFLSGIITLLPILTLMNMRLQIKSMTPETFHAVQVNSILGAVGMIIFTVLIFVLSAHIKPSAAVLSALGIYILFMIIGKIIMPYIYQAA